MIKIIAKIIHPILKLFDFLTPLGDLIARLWVAQIFFRAGLTKIASWSSTLMLFQHEYHVPLLAPVAAAYIGTAAELILPILLVLGLGGRITIAVFFIYNIIAVISYPFLWTADGVVGLIEHINWGILLMLLMLHGPGKISLDYLLRKQFGHLLRSKKQSQSAD